MLLYDNELSGNCYKVRLLFAQLGIDYERREVDVLDRSGREDLLETLIRIRNTPLSAQCRPDQGDEGAPGVVVEITEGNIGLRVWNAHIVGHPRRCDIGNGRRRNRYRDRPRARLLRRSRMSYATK